MQNQKQRTIFKFVLVMMSCVLVLLVLTQRGRAQSDSWEKPVNLSRSGAARDPRLVVDSDGIYHAIWRDELGGLTYTNNAAEDGSWQAPQNYNFPFIQRIYGTDGAIKETLYHLPILRADADGIIHALWTDEAQELRYSYASADRFNDINAWTASERVSRNAIAYDLEIDDAGFVHIVYVRGTEGNGETLGIYHTSRENRRSRFFPEPTQLSANRYFRATETGDAHIDMVVDRTNIWIGWDDPIPERVYIIRSRDSGESWEQPKEIDRREQDDTLTSSAPHQIELAVDGNNVHIIWLAGHGEETCRIYHLFSRNSGNIWRESPIPTETGNCPSEKTLMVDENGDVWLLALLAGEMQLMAWGGSAWSIPLPQPPLIAFTDPDRVRTINVNCRQSQIVGLELLTIGCDLTITGVNQEEVLDIWLLKRPLNDEAATFLPTATPIWSSRTEVGSRLTQPLLPHLINDSALGVHGFWVEAATDRPDERIVYYTTQLNDGFWLRPNPLFAMPTAELAYLTPFATKSGTDDVFYLFWSGGNEDGIVYSSVEAIEASLLRSWKPIERIPNTEGAIAPTVVEGAQGELYVAYTIPLNERRGVFITVSRDGGRTWVDPVQVFDAAAADWERVEPPQLMIDGDGALSMLWAQANAAGTVQQAVYFARSADTGNSWTLPQTLLEEPSNWQKLLRGEDILHLIWQESNLDAPRLWHQTSADNGSSWTLPQLVSGVDNDLNVFDIVMIGEEGPHIWNIRLSGEIQHTSWDGFRWRGERIEPLPDASDELPTYFVKARPAITGDIVLFYSTEALEDTTILVSGGDLIPAVASLNFAERAFSDVDFVIVPTLRPTASPPPPTIAPTTAATAQEAEPIETLIISPQPVRALEETSSTPISRISESTILTMGVSIIPVLLILAIVFAVRALLRRRAQR